MSKIQVRTVNVSTIFKTITTYRGQVEVGVHALGHSSSSSNHASFLQHVNNPSNQIAKQTVYCIALSTQQPKSSQHPVICRIGARHSARIATYCQICRWESSDGWPHLCTIVHPNVNLLPD
eukprot:1979150-Pleurochrysis_carterae.AAC.1